MRAGSEAAASEEGNGVRRRVEVGVEAGQYTVGVELVEWGKVLEKGKVV